MNLGGQSIQPKDNKIKKIIIISIIVAVVALFIVLGIYMYVFYKDSQTLKMLIDNKQVAMSKELFVFDDESGKTYISINDFAPLVGYRYFQGEYNKHTEDNSKCYIQSRNEVTGFELGSNRIYKINPNDTSANYEWYEVQESVKSLNGKLYCLEDAIEKACNLQFTYNQEKNRIQITTLDRLVSYYQQIAVNNYNYAGIDTSFANSKAILYGMLVISQTETDTNGRVTSTKYGVVTLDNKNIIGAKYDAITFEEKTQEFFVTSNKKVGILSDDGAQKIDLNYDEIKVLDNELRLYYVRNGNVSGVLDRNGQRIVYIEYNQIGINSSLYPSNNITNNMLLFDNCIPVLRNEKWGIIDINGNQILPLEYDSLGYISKTSRGSSENNLLIIPEIEGIVVCKDGKYGMINSTGKLLAPYAFDKIYSITMSGKDTFYLTYGEQTIELNDYLKLSQQSTGQTTEQTETAESTTQEGQTVEQTQNQADVTQETVQENTEINQGEQPQQTTAEPTIEFNI
ncbi:MAG: WG repeat-containing protein [Clostridia bacterium]|nr:WG repeat-containing protein [Clostridia bacterium]